MQNLKNAQYDSFVAVRFHLHSNGLAMMPSAGPFPSPGSVVALNGGIGHDLISCVAFKRGGPPTVLSPTTTNPNRVFLQGGRWGNFPPPDFAGTNLYGIGIWLKFGILSPEGLASDFMLGNLPFPGLDQNEYIPGTFFQYQLVNQRQTAKIQPIGVVPASQLPTFISQIAQRG